MATNIKIANPGDQTLIEIEKWLRDNVGLGSHRTIKNGFMGMDDWFYYEDWPEWSEDGEELEDEVEDDEADLIFTFRRGADATMFALKWTTTIA